MEKKILVTKSSMPTIEEYIDEIKEMWETHWLTNMGPKHKKFQEKLKKYLMVENVDLLTNGHMALELSIQALGLQGEIITTPFTFASTTHAIVRSGCKPVFCDIKPDDYTIDETKIESLITENTCAIMPVHVYGNICNVEEIDRIAKKYNLKVIYDAAHAFGVTYKGKGIGEYGDVTCFSFHATKVFNSIEGGAVCFRDLEFGRKIYNLKNFGIRGPEEVEAVGANAKMNEFCAAMGICNLRHIDEEIEKRKILVEYYRKKLSESKGIQLNVLQEDVKTNYAYFPVVIDENIFGVGRDDIFNSLAEHGIGARKYFYPLTNTYECYGESCNYSETPIALQVSKSVLTLPLFTDLELDVIEQVCNIMKSCKKQGSVIVSRRYNLKDVDL